MPSLVRVPQASLTRPIVGTPVHWAGQGALLGALLPGTTTLCILAYPIAAQGWEAVQLMWTYQVPSFVLYLSAVSAGVGAALGLAQPALLDRVRGRVPLAAVALGQTAMGAAAGGLALALAAATDPLLVPTEAIGMAACIAGTATAIGWLPVTMATVLQRRVWPVTVATAVAGPWIATLAIRLGFVLFG